MKPQLEKKNFIPVFIALGSTLLLFLFMLLPHSQYSLLGEMTALNTNIDQNGNLLPLNLNTVLPAIFTLFVILISSVVFIIALLSLFMDRLYNYHFVTKILWIMYLLDVILESLYFFTGLNGVFDNGEKVIEPFNIITFIFCLLSFLAYAITYHFYIERLYKKVKNTINKTPIDEPSHSTRELPQEERIAKETHEEMKKTILDMLSQGKISSEEAYKILKEIDSSQS